MIGLEISIGVLTLVAVAFCVVAILHRTVVRWWQWHRTVVSWWQWRGIRRAHERQRMRLRDSLRKR